MANRILVVDDNSDIRENICEYLNLRGHQTIGASDAASAAQLIAEEDIALIVLDVGLPGEDGMSFCRRLRLAGSSILILMLTARDAVDDRVAGLESGADDYVIKPFSLLELNARVEACPFRCVRSSWTIRLRANVCCRSVFRQVRRPPVHGPMCALFVRMLRLPKAFTRRKAVQPRAEMIWPLGLSAAGFDEKTDGMFFCCGRC